MSTVILMMAALACAIITPAAGVTLLLPSSVFAQQEDTSLGEEGEDLASGIVSGVLDGSSDDEEDDNIDNEENEGGGAATAGDDDGTNAQIAVPITDQDQRDANLAEQLGVNADIVEEEEVVTPTPTEEEPPEFVTFCFLSGNPLLGGNTLLCFDTMEDCKLGEGFIGPVVDGKVCEGFVTPPPDSGDCEITREQGESTGIICTVPQP